MKNFYEMFVKKFDLDYDEVIDVVLSGKEPENQVLIMDLKGLQALTLFGSLDAIRSLMKETIKEDYKIGVLGEELDEFAVTVKIKLGEVLLKYAKAYEMPDDLFQEMCNVIRDGVVCTVHKEHNSIRVMGARLEEVMPAA